MNEITYKNILFKQIKDFPNYYVSKCGKVYSKYSNKIMKIYIKNNNYLFLRLYTSKKIFNKYVHRLVAEAFIPNPENKPEINHIDGNKHNNYISNLEWCTRSENIQHALIYLDGNFGKTGELHPAYKGTYYNKQVEQIDLNGHTIKIWNSIYDIEKELNLCAQYIFECCQGRRPHAYFFIWWWANWYEEEESL